MIGPSASGGTSSPFSCLIVMDSPAADKMVEELGGPPAAEPTHAPTMGALDKVRYSHTDMIDYIIARGRVTNKELAIRYGYSEAWVSNVMASDAWQSAMAARREEIVDPALIASVEERYKGLALHSLERLMERLDKPNVSDQVILRAAELGAKSVGVGGNAPPPPPSGDHLAQLANRLLDLQAGIRARVTQGAVYEGQIIPAE